jgi:outer membrane receptor protein involved in Fe transport
VEVRPATIIGNPFLEAKTTISYEAGVEYQFWGLSTLNLTFFYKDFFGLIGTDVEESATYDPRNPPGITYVNLDYGTAQGLEISLRKRVSETSSWAADFTYTYSMARGSSSSETQGYNVQTGGQDRAPITEQPLNWDRPHVVNGSLYLYGAGVWGLTIQGAYASGAPYTPRWLHDKEIEVARKNSRRLPATFNVDIRADKRYKVYGQEFSLFLEGNNVTDHRNVAHHNPDGSVEYIAYLTEYGQLGGAYNLRDIRQDLEEDVLIPLHDPRVYQAPRSFRVGVQFDW